MICQVCIAFFFFFLLAMSGAVSRCRSTDPCYPNRCMLYWCSEPVYKWSASLTMAGANCYWRLKACWKRPPTNRPPDIAALFLTSNPCRICCCAYRVNESACDTDLNMGICGAHTCPCSQSRLRDTKDCPRTASFVGVRAVFFLFLMRVSSVAEITVILIYLSVSVSKSRDGMLKRLHVPSFSGFYWLCAVVWNRLINPAAEMALYLSVSFTKTLVSHAGFKKSFVAFQCSHGNEQETFVKRWVDCRGLMLCSPRVVLIMSDGTIWNQSCVLRALRRVKVLSIRERRNRLKAFPPRSSFSLSLLLLFSLFVSQTHSLLISFAT